MKKYALSLRKCEHDKNMSVGTRIKEWRKASSLPQKDAAIALDMPLPSLQNYEKDSSIPGGKAISSFISLGVNANWLLTGEGEMFLHRQETAMQVAEEWAEYQVASPEKSNLTCRQSDLIRTAIEAVEEGLAATDRTMPPDKKAELILAVYDLLNNEEATRDGVLRLVKLAA